MDYISPTTVQNYITQASDFTSFSGWEAGGKIVTNNRKESETLYPELNLCGFPDMRNIPVEDIINTEF
jgi:hypothetical protein